LVFVLLGFLLLKSSMNEPHLSPSSLFASAADNPGPMPSTESGHADVPTILLSMVILLFAGKAGGDLFERIKQPSVLGELVVGIILGNLALAGYHGLDYLKANEILHVLAEIGVILLLFEVGLESNIRQMLDVGLSSFLVALLGVITPLLLGWGVSAYFLPAADGLVHVFIGATLAATSVGLTARVLRDLGRIDTKEARIILGAAVIDDVMGLVLLAVVSGIIVSATRNGTGLSFIDIGFIIGKAILFLLLSVWIGQKFSPKMFKLAALFRVNGMLLVTSISFCFFLSYLSSQVGLAPIVGAFAAGLVLDPFHYENLKSRGPATIEELISPLTTLLVPIFFVLMGLRVNLTAFADSQLLLFAGMLTVAAIAGKQVCALGVLERGLDRISVGIGMIPRGEVGLIFAGIGSTMVLKGLPVISPATYSAVVIMVMISTLVTPPLLKISLSRGTRKRE
jgi:Kef-type K+ transport system membrane component KefB